MNMVTIEGGRRHATIFNRRGYFPPFSPETQGRASAARDETAAGLRCLRVRNLTSAVGRSYPAGTGLRPFRQDGNMQYEYIFLRTQGRRCGSGRYREGGIGYIKQTFPSNRLRVQPKRCYNKEEKSRRFFFMDFMELVNLRESCRNYGWASRTFSTGGGPQPARCTTVGVQQPALELCRGGKPGGRAGRLRACRKAARTSLRTKRRLYYRYRRARAAFTAHRGHHEPAFRQIVDIGS